MHLYLPISKKWYDLIESGVKKEDYREINSHNIDLLCNINLNGACSNKHREWCMGGTFKNFTGVVYGLKYFKNAVHQRKRMTFSIRWIGIREGNPEWGAIEGKKYFVIELGERL